MHADAAAEAKAEAPDVASRDAQRVAEVTKLTQEEESNLMRFSLYRENKVLSDLPKVMGLLDEQREPVGGHQAAQRSAAGFEREPEGEEKVDAGASGGHFSPLEQVSVRCSAL